MLEELKQYLSKNSILYEEDVLLSQKSWIKTGGVCSCWIKPDSIAQLTNVCRYLYMHQLDFDIVGNTSNIFFHSSYNPGIIVSTIKVNHYEIDKNCVICDCGVNVTKLAKDLLAKGFANVYGLIGLPGTVGASAVNNASCFNCSISSFLISASCLMENGTIKELSRDAFNYSHRTSSFKRGETKGVILQLKLNLSYALEVNQEIEKSKEVIKYRKEKQEGPRLNLGSVFSNLQIKNNKRIRIARKVSSALNKVIFIHKKNYFKKCILFFYGYIDLDAYISDKSLNTFIWKDKYAEAKFVRYKEFMRKVFFPLSIEIEEKY